MNPPSTAVQRPVSTSLRAVRRLCSLRRTPTLVPGENGRVDDRGRYAVDERRRGLYGGGSLIGGSCCGIDVADDAPCDAARVTERVVARHLLGGHGLLD